jgi:hypothetical protein
MTVARLEAEMSTREFLGWCAYYEEKQRTAAEVAAGDSIPSSAGRSGNLAAMDPKDAIAILTGGR